MRVNYSPRSTLVTADPDPPCDGGANVKQSPDEKPRTSSARARIPWRARARGSAGRAGALPLSTTRSPLASAQWFRSAESVVVPPLATTTQHAML